MRAVTPISRHHIVSRPVRRTRRNDLASRLKSRVRTLRTRIENRETLVDAVREANATTDPLKVASWLVRQARKWIPAPCWVVITEDTEGKLAILVSDGLTADLETAVWGPAHWVLRHNTEFATADLAKDGRVSQDVTGTVLAFPLVCRNQTIGALLGLDPMPSSVVPALGPALVMALRTVLEPPAIALHNALELQKAEALSVTDDLTRLSNSRYLNQALRREVKRALRHGRPLSLLFLDLDGFKYVNDNHGHLAGSKALVEAAHVIRGCARETDVVARFGGDEFSLVLPDTGLDGAVSVAERIRERLQEHPFLADDGLSLHLTASIGVATLPDAAGSAEELLRAADVAMYRVKAGGKNGVHVAQE